MSDTVQECWLPPPFAFFPFTSPAVRSRVPPDSVSTILQNQTLQSYEQGQMVKPTQARPLDFSQSSSPMDTAVLPLQNKQLTSCTDSISHTLAHTPPSPRASFQSEDDEGTTSTENNWQEVRSTKRRKVT